MIIKVCVVGSVRAGKTCLCQVLTEQPSSCSYAPTAGVRVQMLDRQIGQDHVKVQLWDVSGDQRYEAASHVLSKDVDGVVLVLDPEHPEQERDLEQSYIRFAQSHNLMMKQCCVLAVSHEDTRQGGWPGLQGKLCKLPSGHVSCSSSTPGVGRKEALELLDKLLAGCMARKKDKLESAVIGN